jgi:predicted molibdopterin-dependent oxidoreductase YjgC
MSEFHIDIRTRRIHKVSSVCKYCRCSAEVTMVRMRAEFVDPLGRHGRHLQTIEQRLRIVLCV